MSIFANIEGIKAADTRFKKIANDGEGYLADLKNELDAFIDASESDHFISTFSDINEFVKLANSTANLDNVMWQCIKDRKNIRLCGWIAAAMCAFIYGFDGNNALNIQCLTFKDANGHILRAMAYMQNWNEKFGKFGANGIPIQNHNTKAPFSHNGTAMNVFALSSPANVQSDEFQPDSYSNVLGCCSTDYFLIPLREMELSGNATPEWKRKFKEICVRLLAEPTNIDSVFNTRQKVLLHLSANSIGATPGSVVPAAIELLKRIIKTYISSDNVDVDAANVPYYYEICGIKFYKIINTVNLDTLLSQRLYLIGADDYTYREKSYALYPFTENIIHAIESEGFSVQGIALEVQTDAQNANTVTGASVHFN